MKYIIRILILTIFISCGSDENILFEFKDLDDVLYMAESTNIAKLPEEELSSFLLPYEEPYFIINDTTSENYGKLGYNEKSSITLKHLGEIYSNDTFSVHIILREKEGEAKNYKFFLRTLNKRNLVIDNYEIASWVSERNRYCYGAINDKLQVRLRCDEEVENSYIDSNGCFRNLKKRRENKNQIVDYHEFLSSNLVLRPIENDNFETIRVIYYTAFQYGKIIEFSNRESYCLVEHRCYSEIEDPEPCEDFQATMSIEEWKELKRILQEYDFYTEEQVRNTENVLDGFIYIVEGRTQNETSKELQYRFLFRGNPIFDKIGSLCEDLIEFAEYKQGIK